MAAIGRLIGRLEPAKWRSVGPDLVNWTGGRAGLYSRILRAGPLAYWPLDDASGLAAVDHSGNGHDATISGGVTLGQAGMGDGRTAPVFDGVDGKIELPAGFLSAFSLSAGTVLGWVRVADQATWTGATGIYAFLCYSASNSFGIRKTSTANTVQGNIRSNSVNYNSANFAVSSQTLDWFPVAVSWATGTITRFMALHNSLFGSVAAAVDMTVAPTAGGIGYNCLPGTPSYWKGGIAHVAYFDRALSNAEVFRVLGH